MIIKTRIKYKGEIIILKKNNIQKSERKIYNKESLITKFKNKKSTLKNENNTQIKIISNINGYIAPSRLKNITEKHLRTFLML